ncbi:hypothetical protein BROUX41_002913 [Berkeleyomyces rouxiae]
MAGAEASATAHQIDPTGNAICSNFPLLPADSAATASSHDNSYNVVFSSEKSDTEPQQQHLPSSQEQATQAASPHRQQQKQPRPQPQPTPLQHSPDVSEPPAPISASPPSVTTEKYSRQSQPLAVLDQSHSTVPFLAALEAAGFEHPARYHFAFSPAQLRLLTISDSADVLRALGGINCLAAGLRTDISAGLSLDEIEPQGRIDFAEAVASAVDGRLPRISSLETPRSGAVPYKTLYSARRQVYGSSFPPQTTSLGGAFMRILWRRINDKLNLLLLISAIVTLVLAACQANGNPKKYNQEWAEATTTIVALVVLILSRSFAEWETRRRFLQIDDANVERTVKVIRSASMREIQLCELNVGDIVQLEPGDVIPADGLVATSDCLLVDEYSATGVSEPTPKCSVPSPKYGSHDGSEPRASPFIKNGTVVLRGSGSYLVTSLQPPSLTEPFGQDQTPETPIQYRLKSLAYKLAGFGIIAGALYFVILVIRYIIRTSNSSAALIQKVRLFFDTIVNVSTVLIVTIPSSLAFSALVTLASTTSRMMTEGNLVKSLSAVENMGDVTCICTGKSGSLTHSDLSVATVRPGYGRDHDFPEMLARKLCDEVKGIFKSAALLTSSAFEATSSAECQELVGSSVEVALLKFARDHLVLGNAAEERANFKIVKVNSFDSSLMMAFAVTRSNEEDKYRVYVTGAAETVLAHCDRIVEDPSSSLAATALTLDIFESLDASIHSYGRKMLSPVAVAYRDFSISHKPIGQMTSSEILSDLVFVSLLGLQDTVRPDMAPLVHDCHQAGIFVRLVTGENMSLAREIANNCGIFTPGGIVMDGATFRTLSHWQLDLVVPRLQILARATPEDKLLLIMHLRSMGETVATTGSSLNDTLSLKVADVGFAMGQSATPVASQSASILMLNQSLYSIVRAMSWGRTVGDSVRKFLQFQLTLNITAGTVTVISTFVGTLIFNIPQLLWVNLIGTVFGLVALTTDYPSRDFLQRRPHLKPQPLITLTMWKTILCQALYQVLSILTIHYVGWAIFEPDDDDEISDLQTLVFNIYVMMQLFNLHNCRRIDNKVNVHHQGFFKSPWFLISQGIIIVGQVIIVTLGDKAFNTNPLDLYQWAWSILFGFLTLPLGILIRKIPDSLIYCVFQIFFRGYRSLLRSLLSLVPRCWRPRSSHTSASADHHAPQWVSKAGESILMPITYRHAEASEHLVETQSGLMTAPLKHARKQLRARFPGGSKPLDTPNLSDMVEFSRLSRHPVERGLDIHPDTGLNDPVLMKTIGVDGASDPPSQDPEIIKMLSLRSKY